MELPPVEVAGRRLVVRRYALRDAVSLNDAIGASIDHLLPWMPWAALEPLDLADRERLITGWLERWEQREEFVFGVFEGGSLVGGCGLHPRVGPGGLEIGYWTRAGETGRGIATEAAGCLVDVAFSLSDVAFVEVHHDVANTASGRIPERLGFTLVEERADEVLAPGEVGIERIWRLTRTDWPGARPSR